MIRELTEQEIRLWHSTEMQEAFPAQEIKPLDYILRMNRERRYRVFGLFYDEKMYSYFTLWTRSGQVTLLDYFGVTKIKRHQGYGGKLLQEIIKTLDDKTVILESEQHIEGDDLENETRKRRNAFYESNGLTAIYEMATCGMRCICYLLPTSAAMKDIKSIQKEHRDIYGPKRVDIRVPLPKGEKPVMPYWMQKE